MYILKNALISIKRNKGRNILLGIIIMVIACATTVTLAIRNSADTLIESYSNKNDITASISANRENMRKNMGQPPEDSDSNDSTSQEERMEEMREAFGEASKISISEIESYADSEYVKSYYYTSSVNLNADDLDTVTSTSSNGQEMPGGSKMGMGNNQNSGDFQITGYSSYEAMSDFISGKYSITDGEISSDFKSNNCVINAELATLNDISVGDKITLVDPNNEDNTYELTVSGIFEESSNNQSDMMSMFTGSANAIITNVSVINSITESDEDIQVTTAPTFVLINKDAVDEFSKEVSNKGLSEYLTVTSNLDSIENATSSISNVKTFATTFLIITFVIGGIVLFVINLINIRQRKYEIGVLRTIGMKKSLLTTQFTIELLTVSIIAIMLGGGLGSVAVMPVSNSLLQHEMTSSQNEMKEISNNFGGGMKPDRGRMNGVAQIEAFESINATVDGKVLLQLVAIGIGLTLVSSSACMVSIQRFSPLTILKERS